MKPQRSTIAQKPSARRWVQIDASKDSLGRVATKIATILRGKHRRDFTPHIDGGDFVVAVNTGKLKLSGRKIDQKIYYRHSGYLGGLRKEKMKDVMQKDPSEVLRRAVLRMLDEVKFRKAMMARLKTAPGTEHRFQVDVTL